MRPLVATSRPLSLTSSLRASPRWKHSVPRSPASHSFQKKQYVYILVFFSQRPCPLHPGHHAGERYFYFCWAQLERTPTDPGQDVATEADSVSKSVRSAERALKQSRLRHCSMAGERHREPLSPS